jgi:flagellar biosynthesis/type III secretory pathway protein FliH
MRIAAFFMLGFTVFAGSLLQVKAEANLERRSDLALEYANSALDAAREAYKSGDIDKTKSALDEVEQSIDLSYDSLADSGKDPHKSGAFKRAELKARELVRRLDGLVQSASFTDQDMFERVKGRISSIHDDLLNGILSKKKK